MDSTKFDSQEIISKYNLSKIIQKKYAINSLPTLLFLNPQGNITDINTVIENDSSFLAKAMNVVNRNEKFYDKINQSIENKVKNDSLYNLLTIAQDRGDEYAQNIIATAIYKNAKLNISKRNKYLIKDIKPLIIYLPGIITSKDILFKYFVQDPKYMDSILEYPNLSLILTSMIIYKEDTSISNSYLSKSEPNWGKIADQIKKTYNEELSEYIISDLKLKFYSRHKMYNYVSSYTIKKLSMEKMDTSILAEGMLNNKLYLIVLPYSDSRSDLLLAANWMKTILTAHPKDEIFLDTYANLLYKAGNTEDALKYEGLAEKINPKNKSIQLTYLRMKNGVQTW
jgi:hypothetical protein